MKNYTIERLTGAENGMMLEDSEMKYGDLSRRVIGCAMEVHKILGNGFQEVIYQRALAIELRRNRIAHTRETEISVYYKERSVGTRRVDFFIENKIMVEIKAVVALEAVHLAQALNYLEAFSMEIGLLLNFGSKSLEFKRLYNNKIGPRLKD